MSAINCETVLLDVTDENGRTSHHVIPAYTVPETKLRLRCLGLMDAYCDKSRANRSQVSLGDFLLYLVSAAADDPREQ